MVLGLQRHLLSPGQIVVSHGCYSLGGPPSLVSISASLSSYQLVLPPSLELSALGFDFLPGPLLVDG